MPTPNNSAPASLFKYFPRERVNSFGNCLLRFSPLSAFNDPFEGRPDILTFAAESKLVAQTKAVLPEALRDAYRHLSPKQQAQIPEEAFVEYGLQFCEHALRGTVSEFFPMTTAFAKAIPNNLDGAIGALCLCENRDSLLMWAHYASSHTGFLVEYATDHAFMNSQRSSADEFYHLRKVEYRDNRPSTDLMDMGSEELWFVKSRHWEYECEWRILKPLSDADSIIEVNGSPIHLFRHSPDLVRSVTMGARSSNADIEAMRSTLRSDPGFSHVRLCKAKAHESRFQLEFDDLSF